MCAQCMATATVAAAGATGVRAWLATRSYGWLTARLMRRITIGLGLVALCLAATLPGSG